MPRYSASVERSPAGVIQPAVEPPHEGGSYKRVYKARGGDVATVEFVTYHEWDDPPEEVELLDADEVYEGYEPEPEPEPEPESEPEPDEDGEGDDGSEGDEEPGIPVPEGLEPEDLIYAPEHSVDELRELIRHEEDVDVLEFALATEVAAEEPRSSAIDRLEGRINAVTE